MHPGRLWLKVATLEHKWSADFLLVVRGFIWWKPNSQLQVQISCLVGISAFGRRWLQDDGTGAHFRLQHLIVPHLRTGGSDHKQTIPDSPSSPRRAARCPLGDTPQVSSLRRKGPLRTSSPVPGPSCARIQSLVPRVLSPPCLDLGSSSLPGEHMYFSLLRQGPGAPSVCSVEERLLPT